MSTLKDFIENYNYKMKDKISYNSYRNGSRNYTRDYDSVSVTELLGLIEDPNLEMMKEFYSLQMKETARYGTEKHSDLEKYFTTGEQLNDPIGVNFQRALIERDITIIESEKTYKKIYKSLPIITGDIDNISLMNGDKIIIDYKISKKRNFKSKKYNIQLAGYRWLSGISNSAILYLNHNSYEFKESIDKEYYDIIWLELLEYANYLYEKGKILDLSK